MLAGHIEIIAGNPAAAERVLTQARDVLQPQGQNGYLSGVLAWLAEAVYAQGRLAEAERLTEQTMAMAGADMESQASPWQPGSSSLPAAATSPQPGSWPAKQ